METMKKADTKELWKYNYYVRVSLFKLDHQNNNTCANAVGECKSYVGASWRTYFNKIGVTHDKQK